MVERHIFKKLNSVQRNLVHYGRVGTQYSSLFPTGKLLLEASKAVGQYSSVYYLNPTTHYYYCLLLSSIAAILVALYFFLHMCPSIKLSLDRPPCCCCSGFDLFCVLFLLMGFKGRKCFPPFLTVYLEKVYLDSHQ